MKRIRGAKLVISASHEGVKAAVAKVFSATLAEIPGSLPINCGPTVPELAALMDIAEEDVFAYHGRSEQGRKNRALKAARSHKRDRLDIDGTDGEAGGNGARSEANQEITLIERIYRSSSMRSETGRAQHSSRRPSGM